MYMIVEVSQYVAVASFLEAWIEICAEGERRQRGNVASFLEAWIEMRNSGKALPALWSPPSWRRGLK